MVYIAMRHSLKGASPLKSAHCASVGIKIDRRETGPSQKKILLLVAQKKLIHKFAAHWFFEFFIGRGGICPLFLCYDRQRNS